ncbi:hypothetical protein [Actinopolymorpha pittospori]|uniref:ATP-dependent DNA ligase n=1 Tax=Actinopolymorpha pittospori TaxID=648752 RepID=A0A927RI96_9ACTN|nr:hypothetical protein [Actinopolymorpha pittospori]MBE1604338.1 ATP-dependent DNA ligase [Actinopolymorpha pittospori]
MFDVLEIREDGDARRRPLKERRGVLERLFRRVQVVPDMRTGVAPALLVGTGLHRPL